MPTVERALLQASHIVKGTCITLDHSVSFINRRALHSDGDNPTKRSGKERGSTVRR
jgi:hypothetical protein